MKINFKILIIFLALVLVTFIGFTAFFFVYFFVGRAVVKDNITWGVDFSQMQAESLKLDWKETYGAIIDDLGAKNIKLHAQWDWVEGKKDAYFYDDIDWQIRQAEQKNVKIIYVLGMKTGRWPECHAPQWVGSLPASQQQDELLEYIKEVVLRYKNSKAITYWQVENEPLFKFGKCPDWYYKNEDFLKKEVNLVKSLDPSRKIIISDSGEQSSWFGAARIADIVGITLYRSVWAHITDNFGFRVNSFLSPITYSKKADIINKTFGKDVICIELQAEPWASQPFAGLSIAEQAKTMDLDIFKENVEFAKMTGLNTFYFWGAEWWYWMKEFQNKPEIWNEAKKLF